MKKKSAKKTAKKTTKKATKKPTKALRAKKPAAKKVAKSKIKTKTKINTKSKKKTATRIENRREFRRYPTKNLWVTEQSGDYQFVVPAVDLSQGGIFLKGRLKTSREPSQITIHMGDAGSLQLTAQPIYDRLLKDAYGTGYRFTQLAPSQAKALKSFLRNLD